jgi:hypothetical protein
MAAADTNKGLRARSKASQRRNIAENAEGDTPRTTPYG